MLGLVVFVGLGGVALANLFLHRAFLYLRQPNVLQGDRPRENTRKSIKGASNREFRHPELQALPKSPLLEKRLAVPLCVVFGVQKPRAAEGR